METFALDLICLSHLRWGFVYQRPQHLMSRFARIGRVFFYEEPVLSGGDPRLEMRVDAESGVHIITPHLAAGMPQESLDRAQAKLIQELIELAQIENYCLWYYTPMAVPFTRDLHPSAIIYDCMDELSAFKGAPLSLRDLESELFSRASLVFTGGQTLYELKRGQHPDVHAFPSSVDVSHFSQARSAMDDPEDQAVIPHPRIGYSGVIDERMDLELIRSVAEAKREWHLIMIGPIVKIDPASLPKFQNIWYLGPKNYSDLPRYLSGWDVAVLPFARNESTRYISPTKTPEYLAAGLPTVSTSIRDVIRPYGELGLVDIADEPAEFIEAVERARNIERTSWLNRVDRLLRMNSWDETWNKMYTLMESRISSTKERAMHV